MYWNFYFIIGVVLFIALLYLFVTGIVVVFFPRGLPRKSTGINRQIFVENIYHKNKGKNGNKKGLT